MATAPPQQRQQNALAVRKPTPAADKRRPAPDVEQEEELRLPSWRKLAAAEAAGDATPSKRERSTEPPEADAKKLTAAKTLAEKEPASKKVAAKAPPAPDIGKEGHDEEQASAAQGARASGAAEGTAAPASPAQRKEEAAKVAQDAREGRVPTEADREAEETAEARAEDAQETAREEREVEAAIEARAEEEEKAREATRTAAKTAPPVPRPPPVPTPPVTRRPAEAPISTAAAPAKAPRAAPTATPAKAPPAMRRARGPPDAPERALATAETSAGCQLPTVVVESFAQAWGEDFSAVRVHTDRSAVQAADLLAAEAFTLGEHLYFAAARFAPQTPVGVALLAHELAHVVQLRDGELRGLRGVPDPGSPAEVAADALVARRGIPALAPARRGSPPIPPRPAASGEPHAPGSQRVRAAPAARAPPPLAVALVLRRASDEAKTFFDQGYFEQANSWGGATAVLDEELSTDAAADTTSFPTPEASLGPEEQPERPAVAAAPELLLEGEILVPEEAEEIAAFGEDESFGETPALPALGHLSAGAEGDTSAAQAELEGALDDVPTEFDVATSPGERPPVALDGSADPAQTEDQELAAHDQAESLRAQAADAVDQGPGPEQVQPTSYHEEMPLPAAEAGTLDPLEEIPEMAALQADPIPEEVRAATDEAGQPQLQASLAESDASLEAAASDHDAQREQEITRAQGEQDRLDAEATRAQDDEVERARGEIDDHHAATKEQQDAAVADLETQAADERATVQGDIDARVESDTQAIEDECAQAETDAQAEKDAKEAEARTEKEDAERKSEDQSWWESALDAIASFFDALLDAVNAIFDALIEAVGAIIEAAKAAVTAIIDAARDFAVGLVKAFGELLKGLVQDLLGDIFPGLAAALTELIDAAVNAYVAAINWIADQLKAGLLALLDSIGAAITALLEAYRAAINAAIAIARAALTGDWAALGLMVLEAALKLAGIPPESFYEVINNAMAALDTILADPGAFVGNVINAVAAGFQAFADNFLTHLQEGFFAWIVGPLGELGITLPATWDLMGIFSLVMQVLGLTQEGIRLVITEELGETAGKIFDFVWRYVGALITGGLEGLWNEIKNDLGMLWDIVVDGIKSWLLETIVVQAVIRIATMFNPVGALINALVTVWNVYQWLRQNAQRIFGVVQAIVDMIASIAAGNIQPAALAVEGALASLIPIAISLLANLLGLGGITDKVREILESVRETVREAIRSLIRRVKGLFTGGTEEEETDPDAPAGGDTVLGETVPAQGGGESHTISIQEHGMDAVLTIASDPTPAEQWLSALTTREPWSRLTHDETFVEKKNTAMGLAAQIDTEADQLAQLIHEQASSGEPPAVDDDSVEAKERRFAAAVSEMLAYAGGVDPLVEFATQLDAMPPGSGAYAREQIIGIPDNLKTPDWALSKGWLESRTGFSSFMGEHSRVGRDDTVPIVRDEAQSRLTAVANGTADPDDLDKVLSRSKAKIQAGEDPYGPVATAMKEFIFAVSLRGTALTATRTAYAGTNPDIAFVTNELRPEDQAVIDQYDAAMLPMIEAGEIKGNPIGLRRQFEGMLRSANGLKYVFASGFRVQMQRIIAAAVRPTRLHGVEVSIANRRADYTEWSEGELIMVIEVKNWTGQARWTPDERTSFVAELEAQVRDHLGNLRSGPGPDDPPIGGVRVEIRGGIPQEVTAMWGDLEAFAATLPTVIPGRSKRLELQGIG